MRNRSLTVFFALSVLFLSVQDELTYNEPITRLGVVRPCLEEDQG